MMREPIAHVFAGQGWDEDLWLSNPAAVIEHSVGEPCKVAWCGGVTHRTVPPATVDAWRERFGAASVEGHA